MGKPKSKSQGAGVNRVRMLDGKPVQMCLYNGVALGHGKYFAAMMDGKLLMDAQEKPRHFKSVGALV